MFRLAEENLHRKSIIKLTDLKILYDNNENMTNVEGYLTKLIADFDVSKGELSPNDRHLMRQHFLTLAEQYQNQNNSERVVLLAQILADHAYKLPECK